jgi:hypothetical protein
MPLLLAHYVLLLLAIAANGVVRIHSEPDAAVLWNDIEVGKIGPTGALTVKDLPPGIYTVTVKKDGFKTLSTRVKVTPGEQTVRLSLEQEPSQGIAGALSSVPLDVFTVPPDVQTRLAPGLTRREAPPPPKKRSQPRLKLDFASPFDPPAPEEPAELADGMDHTADFEEGGDEAAMVPAEGDEPSLRQTQPSTSQTPPNSSASVTAPGAEESGTQGSLAVIFLLCLLAGLYYLLFWKKGWKGRFDSSSEPLPALGPQPEPGPVSESPHFPLTSRRSAGDAEELFFLDDLKRREKEMDQPVEEHSPRRKRAPVIDITPHAARFEDEG